MFLVEHKLPRIIHEFSFNLWSILGNSCSKERLELGDGSASGAGDY